ncbi:MAG TPA: cyanase [Candidatus Dormibacteraeota bacterium]|nr:cyanase [Candidatus Dormibacteraeota bacterium]
MLSRAEATDRILAAKESRGLSFRAIAEHVGRDPVWTTSALLGQQVMDAAEADAVVELLGLDREVAIALQRHPSKGSLSPTVPTDPLIYRFYEIVQVYGTTLKALIEEEFGAGIMSAIDFEMHVERMPDPKGDRVRVTMHGKFLPYRKW